MPNELISIIMPTYNRQHFLARAIESIVSQSYTHWELFIVDDGSTDGTEAFCKALTDSRIHYVKHEKNKGACAARNTGMALANGSFFAWFDSDDEWAADKLEAQIACFASSPLPDLGVVTCGATMAYQNGKSRIWLPQRKGWVFEHLFAQETIGVRPQYLLVKRAYLEHPEPLWFDDKVPARQDFDFAMRLLQRCQMDYVPRPLVTVHHHDGERVWTPERAITANQYFHEKYSKEFQKRPSVHNKHHLRTALSLIALKRWQEARVEIKEAIAAQPVNPVSYFWYLYSLAGKDGTLSRLHLAGLKMLRLVTFPRM